MPNERPMQWHILVPQFDFDAEPIEYLEMSSDGRPEMYSPEQTRAVRKFLVRDYTRRWDFVSEMCGWAEPFNWNGIVTLRRRTPEPYRDVRKLSLHQKDGEDPRYWLWARSAPTIVGKGRVAHNQATSSGWYTRAIVKIEYAPRPYAVLTDDEMSLNYNTLDESILRRYVTRVPTPNTQFFQLPRGSMKWESDLALADQTIGRVVNRIDYTYIWHEVPGIPLAALDLVGKINKYRFDGLNAETMYLYSMELHPHRYANGRRSYNIHYRIRYFNISFFEPIFAFKGHNWFLRYKQASEQPFWDRPFAGDPNNTNPSSREYVFRSGDFANLFRGPFNYIYTEH